MKHFTLITALSFSSLVVSPASASTILQASNMGVGSDWNQAFWGSPTAATPTAGNAYENALGGNNFTRTAPSGNSTFAGDSLLLSNSSALSIKSSGVSTANFILEANAGTGARITNGGSNNATLAGTITTTGSGRITFDSQGTNRLTQVTALVTIGAAVDTIQLIQAQTAPTSTVRNSGFVFSNSLNQFTGTWNVVEGLLHGTTLGSLGTSSFDVGALGYLDFDYDYSNPLGTLTLAGTTTGGILDLDQNLTFGSVNIWGTSLAPGSTYTAADLITTLGISAAAFENGLASTGSITVAAIPEPSRIALIGLGGCLLLVRRRTC